jgi:integrase
MHIFRPPNSPNWHVELWCGGRKHRRTTQKRSRREAEAVARQIEKRLLDEHRAGLLTTSSLTYADTFARYLHETGADQETERQLARCLSFVGPDNLLIDHTDDVHAKLVAWRRGHHRWDREGMPLVSNATVNRTTHELMRRVCKRAKLWGVRFKQEPQWGKHRLEEPPERARELHGGEREALDLAMRGDYGPVLAFAQMSGFRLRENLLRWSEVNWHGRVIVKTGKGGKKIRTRITPAVETLLAPLVGHHPVFVFTYIAKSTRAGRVRGRRYPITYEGLKTEWRHARTRAGVSDLRFHDLRHDFGTRVQRACGNIKVTQRALNHSDIRSTLRYINVRDDEVTAALEAAQTAPTIAPTGERKAG